METRLDGVGPLILELRQLTLTVFEADDLADKLSALGGFLAEIQEDDRKQREDDREMKERRRGR